jgi:diguanylate cyclase (GGDEF)-like protein
VLYHRGEISISDGVVFRGFDEHDTRRLRDVLVGEKAVNLEAISDLGVVAESPMHAALRSLEIAAEPALAIPVAGRESEYGVIWAFEGGRPFTNSELERVELISGHARLALCNAERYNHAKERAFIDDVTEVYNARYLLQATEHEIQRAERYKKKLTVLFLDLDRFKVVNDQYGHMVGSRVLRQLSEILTGCIRQVDTLARYGGDEFTILLTDTGHEAGLAVAERIRRTVADSLFESGAGAPIHLEISIGTATYPDHSEERDALLDIADKAMYLAKSRGRNCVCSASSLGD